jgi:hypothetical protein
MGMFAVLLVRRFGLGVGTWLFVYYISQFWPSATEHDMSFGKGMAWGAAILAFFLPRPGPSSKASKSEP